jgi:REP element-mobilizing transposase RayT
MPRRARLDAPGTLHHVIIRGIERRNIVDDDADRDAFINRMGRLSVELNTPIFAWSLMTNHAHILLKSGASGLPAFMRKLLTGYAINYNKRHRRYGHLFQNRYKSIICEQDAYFKELVRYIHLNPLRAGLVDKLTKLDWFKWSGHSVVMGRRKNQWQDREYVLDWFVSKEREAKQRYREFVKKGIALGKQPELVGGGLIRSLGGWAQVKAIRRIGEKEASDERILGSGHFVEHIIQQASLAQKYRYSSHERKQKAEDIIDGQCRKQGITIDALRGGSRRSNVSKVRAELSVMLVEELGISLAEAARMLGVTTSGVTRAIRRRK